jgi:hypothetical protein
MVDQVQVLAKLDTALAQARYALITYCDLGNLPAVKMTLERIDTLLDQRFALSHAAST